VLKNERQEMQTLAIGDFDTAKDLKHKAQAVTIVGTPSFMAPEVLAGAGAYDLKADIYSFGMVLYEMLTLQFPFHDTPMIAIAAKIMSGDRPTLPDLDSSYEPLVDLFVQCTHLDPRKRPTTKAIKERLVFDIL
jgi:serine/threonine protein kinase